MKKFLFTLAMFFACSQLFAADIWETSEEIDVNGTIAEKSVVISDSVMKVVNASPNGDTETLVDLNASNSRSSFSMNSRKNRELSIPKKSFRKSRSTSWKTKQSISGTVKYGTFRLTANLTPKSGSLRN